jgi:Acetyltransferase (GNAT) family
MPDLAIVDERSMLLPLPTPKVAINIRPAVLGDLSFVDSLQRKHTKAVGWMPTAQLEGCIKQGKVLVAEERRQGEGERGRQGDTEMGRQDAGASPCLQVSLSPCLSPVGYCIAADRYFKRDDVGIIYQMNVEPGRQRGFIGAALLKAQFERSAYGCKLYCCWCAQDLAANKFWEAMGFVPLAFRTGGTGGGKSGKVRMHIFWQKRIRSGDESTPWWFPSETSSGAIRANRIVLPIPPGTHWSDAKPIVLPGMETIGGAAALPAPRAPRVKKLKGQVIEPKSIASGGLRFGPVVIAKAEDVVAKAPFDRAQGREKKEAVKNDPRLVAAARELKDRWLEQVNATPMIAMGKYEVSRTLENRQPAANVAMSRELPELELLEAPMAA